MKRILAMTTAAAMTFGIVGYAAAQATGIDAGGSANVGVGAGPDTGAEVGAGVGATGSIGAAGDANLGGVVSAINSGRLGTAELRGVTEVSSVNVIRIDELPGGAEQQAIEQALDRHQAEVDDLRAEFDARAELQSALEAEGVSSDDVVAAQVNADGTVTVFVR